MALTHTPPVDSLMLPEFNLIATDGKYYSNQSFNQNKRGLLVMFICNHCPYVIAVEDRIIALGNFLKEQNFSVVAICSNDSNQYKEDSYENLKLRAESKQYPFPYLFDESQIVAKSFGAVCTPDFFLFDSYNNLAYRGQLDDSWKDPTQVTKHDLKEAALNIINGLPVSSKQIPSMGCSIKWK